MEEVLVGDDGVEIADVDLEYFTLGLLVVTAEAATSTAHVVTATVSMVLEASLIASSHIVVVTTSHLATLSAAVLVLTMVIGSCNSTTV